MITETPQHPLAYFATLLSQMTVTLKDFDMAPTAALLEQAKAEIEQKLATDRQKTGSEGGKMFRREGRR